MQRNKIVVLGNDYYGYPFAKLGNVVSDRKVLLSDIKRVKLVVFTGGEDVSPELYGGKDPFGISRHSQRRDRLEKLIFNHCMRHNIKMTGICRGMQFLNVMAGGFMYQHVINHEMSGYHEITFPDGDLLVNSLHHQLVGLSEDSISIAHSNPKRSNMYIGQHGRILDEKDNPSLEVEAAIFPQINAVGVQYHPEIMDDRLYAKLHYRKMINDFLEMDMDAFIKTYGRTNNVKRSKARTVG